MAYELAPLELAALVYDTRAEIDPRVFLAIAKLPTVNCIDGVRRVAFSPEYHEALLVHCALSSAEARRLAMHHKRLGLTDHILWTSPGSGIRRTVEDMVDDAHWNNGSATLCPES